MSRVILSFFMLLLVVGMASLLIGCNDDDNAEPVKRSLKIYLAPMVLTAGHSPASSDPSYKSDDDILKAAVQHSNDCENAKTLMASAPADIEVCGVWGQGGIIRYVSLEDELIIEMANSVSITPKSDILVYLFNQKNHFYNYLCNHLTESYGDLEYPVWSLMTNNEVIKAQINKWVDWENRAFYGVINDLNEIYALGSDSSEYGNLPQSAKSLNVAFSGDEETALYATQRVRVWAFRNYPALDYDGVLLPDENGVHSKYFTVKGKTTLIDEVVNVNFRYHSHIFVNQRALRYDDPSVLNPCERMVLGEDYNRRVNALQTTIMHEVGHILTLPYDLHCGNEGCLMYRELNKCKSNWICSTTWYSLRDNFKWGLD